MIQLTLPARYPDAERFLARFDDLPYRYELIRSEDVESPILKAYGSEYIGQESIQEGIKEIDKLFDGWYACRCDMFEG